MEVAISTEKRRLGIRIAPVGVLVGFAMSEIGKGKYLYDVVTVAERGQIVIPKEARGHFNIRPGDELLVTGDIKRGIGIVKAPKMKEFA